MKKMLAGLLAVSMVGSASMAFAADTGKITVTVNGETVKTDVAPVMENDRILLPMRAIFETLGCNVSYRVNDGKQFVTAFRGDKQVILEIGKNEITVDGETKALDVAAKIENNRTLVPVRAVSEAMNADVSWNGETKTAEVTTKQGEHKIGSVTDEKAVKADDGTVLMYINYVYPVIGNKDGNEYIGKINDEYKAYAEKFIADAEALAAKIAAVSVKVSAKVSENGKIYGSITTAQLADALVAAGVEVDKKDITILSKDVKETGTFEAEVKCYKNVKGTFKFEVVAE